MYISTKQFAAIARLHPKSAARICRQAHEGNVAWLGHKLDVRMTKGGPGGRAGKAYEISVASLPEFYRHALVQNRPITEAPYLTEPCDGQTGPRPSLARDLKQHDWQSRSIGNRYRTIKPVLRTQHGSRLRRERVHDAAIESGVSPKTIYRWLHAYELHGLAGLAPQIKRPRQPIVVSRRFDKAFIDKFGRNELLAVGEELVSLVKSIWASSQSDSGAAAVARDVATMLRLFCEKRGWHDDDFVYEPSRSQVLKFKRYRYLWLAGNDAYALRNALPRIKRDYSAIDPMECVFADVKYLDNTIVIDGKRHRPFLIAFLDSGTGRIFGHLVRGSPGKSAATKKHVKEAFAAMICDPDWGVPKTLYVDKGGENKGFDDALCELGALAPDCRVIRARAHNPQAKPIEGMFAVLNRHISSNMPGFTGGKPGKRRAALGQRYATPFTGSWHDFVADYRLRLEDYHRKPRRGRPSPDAVFDEKIKGKQLHVLDADHVMSILTGVVVRRPVRQGHVTIKGERYYSPVLTTRSGERITVRSRAAFADGNLRSREDAAAGRATSAAQADQDDSHIYYFEDEDGVSHDLEKTKAFGPTDPKGLNASIDQCNDLAAQIAAFAEERAGKPVIPTTLTALTRKFIHLRDGKGDSKSGVSSANDDLPNDRDRTRREERERLNGHILAIGNPKANTDERHAPEYHLEQMLEDAEQRKHRYICSMPSGMGMDDVITGFLARAPDTRYHAVLKKGCKPETIIKGIRTQYTDLITSGFQFSELHKPEVIILTGIDTSTKSAISELVSRLIPMLDQHKIGLVLVGNDEVGLPTSRLGNIVPSAKVSQDLLTHFDFFRFSFDQFSDDEIINIAKSFGASPNVAKLVRAFISDGSIAGSLVNIRRAVNRLLSAKSPDTLSVADAKVRIKRT